VKTTHTALKNVIGIAGLLIAGYVFVNSLSDIRRYIRIVRM
jgi:hypothetical protein